MSVSNIRNVIGQPGVANVQLASTAQQVANQNTQNILQYNVNRSGIIQGTFAPVSNSATTPLPVRAVLESSPAGTSFAATPVGLQGTTVRSMLNTKREGQPTLVMVPNATQPKPAAQQPTLLNVQKTNNANKNNIQKQVFVDLTDDDDANSKKIGQPVPTAIAPNNAIALRPATAPTLAPQSIAIPVRPGQITLRPGTQIVLNGSSGGPMFFQPLAAQRMGAPGTVQSKPQTFIYAPSTIPAQTNRVLTLLPQQQTSNTSTTFVSTGVTGPIQTPKIVTTPQVSIIFDTTLVF
jgi:hypothetical protein